MHISLRDRAGYPIQDDSDSYPYYCLIRESKISLLAPGTRHSLSTEDFSNNLHPLRPLLICVRIWTPAQDLSQAHGRAGSDIVEHASNSTSCFLNKSFLLTHFASLLFFHLVDFRQLISFPRCQRFLNVSLMSVSLLPHGVQ
jgi:hypothetical protein